MSHMWEITTGGFTPSLLLLAFLQLPGMWEVLNPPFLSMEKQHPAPLTTSLAGNRASAREFCWLLILSGMGVALVLRLSLG